MNALPKSSVTPSQWWSTLEFPWDETAHLAPVMVATMASYLDQLGVSARPSTVTAAEQALRHFAGQVTEADPTCSSMTGRRTPPHRGPQALAGRTAGQGRKATLGRHHPQPTRNPAHVLRAAAGLGLRRRPESDVDLPR
jgi:hypothetical protein